MPIVIVIKENYSHNHYHPSHLPSLGTFSPLGRKEPSETHLLIHQPFPISQKSSLIDLFLISSNGTQYKLKKNAIQCDPMNICGKEKPCATHLSNLQPLPNSHLLKVISVFYKWLARSHLWVYNAEFCLWPLITYCNHISRNQDKI